MGKKLLLTLFFVFIIITSVSATIYRVTPTGNGDGGTWDTAANLQLILSVATNNDEIWVAEGTYYSGTTRDVSFVIPEGVNIYGGFTNEEIADVSKTTLSNYTRDRSKTILSGEIGAPDKTDNSYHVVVVKGGNIIDGFTITGGYADESEINQEQELAGAGIFIKDEASGSIVISNNIISNNIVTGSDGAFGGAIFAFTSNLAEITIIDNIILKNTAISNDANTYGGGVYLWGKAKISILKNQMIDNVVSASSHDANAEGGAIFAYISGSVNSMIIAGNTIKDNIAIGPDANGGGLCLEANSGGSMEVFGNVIVGNTVNGEQYANGGGIYAEVYGTMAITNNTITGNKLMGVAPVKRGNGVCTYGAVNIYNSIIWNNTGDATAIGVRTENTPPIVSHCLVQGGFADGTNILDANPMFVSNTDLSLQQNSLAINRGG